MSKNRPRSPASLSKKGTGSSSSQTKSPKAAGSPKKSASSQRFAERQARKQEAAMAARRARHRLYGLLSIALVLVILVVLVVVKVLGSGGNSGNSGGDVTSPPVGSPIPAATLAKMASIPLSTLAAAPTSGIVSQVQPVSSTALTANGKPELLFVGAEFCPFCAAQRWAMYIALSKFGTFDPEPGRIHSATRDGNVPTLTFYGTKYSSPYFAFTPVEVYTNKPSGDSYTTLQVPTREQSNLWQNLGSGSFPFLDFAGKEALTAAQYSYLPMENLPFDTVAAQVGNNSTTIGANINAGAYQLILAMCRSLSSHQPAAVCSAVSNG